MDIVSRQRINVLIHLAEIPSVATASPEAKLIKRVAKECNFSKAELNRLIESPEPIGSFGALSPKQKQAYMNNICELIAVKKLNWQKKLFCQELAYQLDYNIDSFRQVLATYQQPANQSASAPNQMETKHLVKSMA